MKAIKIIAALAATSLLVSSCGILGASSQQAAAGQNTGSFLTSTNGINTGIALLSLYVQYKNAGKIDIANANNLANIATIASNIQGLDAAATKASTTANFISGLISGSQNLVNQNNSASVLNTLAKVNNLDLSSLVSSAATSAATSLINKAATGATTAVTNAASGLDAATTKATNSATSLLGSLFKTLAK